MITQNDKKDIEIRSVLMAGEVPKFVEFYSHVDSRNHIISADRFMVIFGYSMEELVEIKERREMR